MGNGGGGGGGEETLGAETRQESPRNARDGNVLVSNTRRSAGYVRERALTYSIAFYCQADFRWVSLHESIFLTRVFGRAHLWMLSVRLGECLMFTVRRVCDPG